MRASFIDRAYPFEPDPGIDYGLGTTNIGELGVRYGVLSINAPYIDQDVLWTMFEADYGQPTCPVCGNDLVDFDSEYVFYKEYRSSACDYLCHECLLIVGSDYSLPEEPLRHVLRDDGYAGAINETDIIITLSPFYTHAQFCSPCAPGAGHLEHPCYKLIPVRFLRSRKSRIRRKWAKRSDNHRRVPLGVRTYCLGHDYFYHNQAPYPVFDVVTNKEVVHGI